MRNLSFILIIILVILSSCSNKEEAKLRERVQREYKVNKLDNQLSSGSKAQYIQMEKTINQNYVKQLDSLISTGFDRQLQNFEDKELGLIASYRNMLSWLFSSKDSWNEELNLKSSKYFNTLDLEQEQNTLYIQYLNKIKGLRQQFVSQQQLPTYTQFDLPKERISLEAFSKHTQSNIGIEAIGELLGSNLFSWFLGFAITWIVVTFLGIPAGPPGWLISVISFIIVIVISAIMSYRNDSKLMDQLKEQHK